MPWWTAPSRSILSPTPVFLSNSAVPCSSTPARTVVSTTSRLRSSSTTDSMPCRPSSNDPHLCAHMRCSSLTCQASLSTTWTSLNQPSLPIVQEQRGSVLHGLREGGERVRDPRPLVDGADP